MALPYAYYSVRTSSSDSSTIRRPGHHLHTVPRALVDIELAPRHCIPDLHRVRSTYKGDAPAIRRQGPDWQKVVSCKHHLQNDALRCDIQYIHLLIIRSNDARAIGRPAKV